jgi:tetratricopeptide (TPR) repeat protein
MDQQGLPLRLLDDASAVADAWRLAGRWEDALTLLRGLWPIALAQRDAALASLALQMGRVLVDQAIFARADTTQERDALLERALTHAEAAGSDALRGDVWDAKGWSLHAAFLAGDRNAEPPDELPFCERGLALRRAAGDQRGVAESLFHVGLVYSVIRRDDLQALPYFQEAYRLAREVGDPVTESYAIRHIAFAHLAAGDIRAARAGFAESLRLREGVGFLPGVAMALVACGEAAQEDGDRAGAIAFLERARAIFVSLAIPRQVAWVETLLAQLNPSA